MKEFTVVEIGEMVAAFEEELIVILFGETAPPELRAISVVHDYQASDLDEVVLQAGTRLHLGRTCHIPAFKSGESSPNPQRLGSIYGIIFIEKPKKR